VRLWLTLDEAKDLVAVSDCHAFSDLAQAEKFTTSGQNGDTEFLRSDLMAYKARVAAKAAAEEKAKEAEKKAPDVPPTGPKKSEDSETHTAKCRCGCRIRTRAGATATVGDIHVHLPAPAPAEEKHTAKMPWWLIPLVVLATLLGLWLIKGLVSGTSKETAAVPAAAKGEVDTAKAATVDPDATTPPPAAKAVDEEARAAVKVAQETAKNAALVAERAAADLKVHAADAENRWAAQTEKNSELDAADDAIAALAAAKSVRSSEPPATASTAPASLTAEQSAALVEFTRIAKFGVGCAKKGRSPVADGCTEQVAASKFYPTLKGIGAARIRAEVPTALVSREYLDTMLVSLQIQ
jgi:hypothetical protein